MEFFYLSASRTLHGISPAGLSLIEGEKFGRANKNDQRGLVIQLIELIEPFIFYAELNPALCKLIDQYQNVFKEPRGLPHQENMTTTSYSKKTQTQYV